MDANINEFDNANTNSNISKFLRYNKNTSQPYSSSKNDEYLFTEPSLTRKKHTRYVSSHNINTGSLYQIQQTEPSPQVNESLSALYSSQDLMRVSMGLQSQKLKLSIVDLSNNNLDKFPQEILTLTALRLLKLDNNSIRELPQDLHKLSKLEVLILSYNKLAGLPSTFNKMTALKELNLEANWIETLSDQFTGLKNLQTLNLYQNRLIELPYSIKDLTSLIEFHSEWFHYTKPRLCAIQKGIEGRVNIFKLKSKVSELARNKIKGMSFRAFIDCFSTEIVSFNQIDGHNRTLLHHACLNEDLSVVRFLCTNVPELKNALDKDDLTPFGLSLLKDKTQAVEYLLKQKVDIVNGGSKYGSPLHMATKKMNRQLVKEIIETGGDPNRIDAFGNTPLHYAISFMAETFDDALPIVQLLLENNANPNAKNKENWAPLHLIARKGEIYSLQWMIFSNLEVNEVYGGEGQTFNLNKRGGAFKWTALHIAAYTGSAKMIKLLGEAGADLFKRSSHGYVPKAMIRRNGLALKLLERFEKEFIHKNVLTKKNFGQKTMTIQEVHSPVLLKHISFASKNKFRENIPVVKPFAKPPLPYVGAKVRCGDYGNSSLDKRQVVDSYDILPETEAGFVDSFEENRLTEMEVAQNLCIETESGNVDADLYFLNTPLTENGRNNSLNTTKVGNNHSIKHKNNLNLPVLSNFSIGEFENKLKKEPKFGLEYCKQELENLSMTITSEIIMFSEKLKVLMGFKALNQRIIDHIYQKFEIPAPKEQFSSLFVNNNNQLDSKYGQMQYFRKDEVAQITQLFELVPQGLMSIFRELDEKSYQYFMLKQNMCKILGEIKYYSAIGFLRNIVESNKENILVVQEARRVHGLLKSTLELSEPKKIQQELLKKQYAKTLRPKVSFSANLIKGV